MKHEIIELHDVQIIGMSKKIAFDEAKEECPKFWGEYVEKIIRPVMYLRVCSSSPFIAECGLRCISMEA